jgi:hypothetical protein
VKNECRGDSEVEDDGARQANPSVLFFRRRADGYFTLHPFARCARLKILGGKPLWSARLLHSYGLRVLSPDVATDQAAFYLHELAVAIAHVVPCRPILFNCFPPPPPASL